MCDEFSLGVRLPLALSEFMGFRFSPLPSFGSKLHVTMNFTLSFCMKSQKA